MAVVGLVAAAGAGTRLGTSQPKAFVSLVGRPLLDWSLDVLELVCDRVVVATPPGYEAGAKRVRGGSSRSESVRAALALVEDAEICVVHDAARPLVTAELVNRCIEIVEAGLDGAIAAARVTDTVKEADPQGQIARTLDRNTLWLAQTPQVFRADALRRALAADEASLARATDDSYLVEACGGHVALVEASTENIKVTTQLDLEFAELLLRRRGSCKPGP